MRRFVLLAVFLLALGLAPPARAVGEELATAVAADAAAAAATGCWPVVQSCLVAVPSLLLKAVTVPCAALGSCLTGPAGAGCFGVLVKIVALPFKLVKLLVMLPCAMCCCCGGG